MTSTVQHQLDDSPSMMTVDWPALKKDFEQDSPRQSVVVRVWQTAAAAETKAITDNNNNNNKLLICYGIHLNGLVPYNDDELLLPLLRPNALVFHTRSGYSFVAPDSIDLMNIPVVANYDDTATEAAAMTSAIDDDDSNHKWSPAAHALFHKYNSIEIATACAQSGCTLDQLLKLQQGQLRLKYKRELLRSLIMEIQSKSAICMDEANNVNLNPGESSSTSSAVSPAAYYNRHSHHHHQSHHHNHHHSSVGSMGKTLTRLLNMEPERVDPQTRLNAFKLRKQIEAVRVRCRLLATERDRARRHVTTLEAQRVANCDRNVETDSSIMASYHAMSKEKEQYLHLKLTLTKDLDTLTTNRSDWRLRKQTLLREICEIYDVREHEGGLYTINGISLPDAEAYENTHVPAMSISVALGYVAHLVLVVSNVLAVPLRNPIIFKGSQSQINGQLQIMNTNV